MTRIISQNRCVDVPYENAVLSIEENEDVVLNAKIPDAEEWDIWGIVQGEYCYLGSYPTKERCMKILEEIRNSQGLYLMPKE